MTEEKKGIIVKSTGGLYTVALDDGTLEECRAKGAFRHNRITPLAGDRVTIEASAEREGVITEIAERKNSLIRPAAANIDALCIVAAVTNPEPDLFILDKLTAVAAKNKIDVLFIINKVDISGSSELSEIYRNSGFEVLEISAINGEKYADSIARIRDYTRGKTSFFTGASGVGKSSVLNAAFPELMLETGEISKKIQRGKHTTRVTRLFNPSVGTYVGDTPGFSMLDVAGFNMLDAEGLLSAFPDIEKFAHECKYKKCTHTCEDGCGVVEALRDGKIVASRHQSFVTLFNELKEIKPWENKIK